MGTDAGKGKIPDGYGMGLAVDTQGGGYLSGQLKGAVTFNRTAALALTEILTVAASHTTRHIVPALALVEVLTIAASHTNHTSAAVDVTLSGPFGSMGHGGSAYFQANYTASPTGQTNATVTLFVSGAADTEAGLLEAGLLEEGLLPLAVSVAWDDGPASPWTLDTDWTAGPNIGDWYSVVSRSSIDTGNYIGEFVVNFGGSEALIGSDLTVENDYQPTAAPSHTDQANSAIHTYTNAVT